MTGGQFQLATQVNVAGVKAYLNGAAPITLTTSQTCTQTLTFGTNTGLMSVEVNQSRGLGAGSSETLNLYDGSLLDIYGDPATLRTLRSYAIFITAGGDANGLSVAGGASNPTTLFWTGTTPGKVVYPSGPAEVGGSPAGLAVTSAACTLLITNNSQVPVTYSLILAGSAGVSGSPMGLLLGLTYP